MIEWIHNIWYDDTKIKPDSIIKSFLKCGISNSLDGLEDEYFEWADNEAQDSDN